MKVVGLGAAPETVRAVVPSVSVKTPEVLTLIWFPLRSVVVAEPEPELMGGTEMVPLRAIIVALPPVAWRV